MFVKLHITDKTEECLVATTWTLVKRINFMNILSVCGEGGYWIGYRWFWSQSVHTMISPLMWTIVSIFSGRGLSNCQPIIGVDPLGRHWCIFFTRTHYSNPGHDRGGGYPSLLLMCFEELLINDLRSFIGFWWRRGYIFWKIKRECAFFLILNFRLPS